MQPVGGRQVARPNVARPYRFRVLAELAYLTVDEPDVGVLGRLSQRRVQDGSAHPEAAAGAEARIDPLGTVDVGDPAQRPALDRDAQPVQVSERMRHHALATGLVQHAISTFDDDDLESGAGPVQRGGQARRATAADEQVLRVHLENYCADFGLDVEEVLKEQFVKVLPKSKRPYSNMYCQMPR